MPNDRFRICAALAAGHRRRTPQRARLCGWLAAFALLFAIPGAASAKPAAPEAKSGLRIELNKLEPKGQDCRAYLVFANHTAKSYDALRLDLIIFGTDGVIARRLSVDVGALPARKTNVRLFDLAGLPCDGIGQLLLNDIPACGAPGDGASCLDGVSTASRIANVPFAQ
jgi:hypothetical protein